MEMSKLLKIILAANLMVFAALVFIYPHLMVAPGKLIPGHKQFEKDCFACHASFRGADSTRCVICHKPADIGRLTSAGLPIAKPVTTLPFHQNLANLNCLACHSDHAGVQRFRKQGRFDHTLLQRATLEQCQSCHKSPSDTLHRQISGNCGQCHNQIKWVPATFDHGKYFALEGDHNASCVTCHSGNDYERYTCYGCHEHTPDNIRRKHIEEGMRNFDNCVECHRSASEHGEGNGEGKRHNERHGDD
jgi:hypothetical protein